MAADAEKSTKVRARVAAALAPSRGRIGGPYSRAIDRGAVGGIIDGRSREGRFLRSYEKQLTEHVGDHPSITQRCLIQRASRLALHLELMDERSLAGDHIFTTHDHLHYVSWSNSLARMLDRLGLGPAVAPAMDATEYARLLDARRPAADAA